jgi:hypothetical protein
MHKESALAASLGISDAATRPRLHPRLGPNHLTSLNNRGAAETGTKLEG